MTPILIDIDGVMIHSGSALGQKKAPRAFAPETLIDGVSQQSLGLLLRLQKDLADTAQATGLFLLWLIIVPTTRYGAWWAVCCFLTAIGVKPC